MEFFGLPAAAADWLRSGEQLRYDAALVECGAVTLKAAHELEDSTVWVDGEGRGWHDDPHRGDLGYYTIPVVDLLADADGYDPDGILLWIPALQTLGTWDSDHWDVILFRGASWEDIASDPATYLNAQWEDDGDYLRPWEHGFEWSPGRP